MDEVIVSSGGRQLTLTLNRPDSRNALNTALISRLREALGDAAADDSIRTVVITGTGSTFSAGADLVELKGLASASLGDNIGSSRALASLFDGIRRHPKVVIARVNGHAIAGGCGLAVACDFAIAASGAKFGFTEVRIGFVPALVSALLRGRVPDPVMRDLLLTGRVFDAAEARDLGLIGRVVEAADLDTAVAQISETIAEKTSPAAVAMTKRMLAATSGLPQGTVLEILASFNVLARQTDDVSRGVGAFLEKREIGW